MFCQKCGNEIIEGDMYCTNCGTSINNDIPNDKKIIKIKFNHCIIVLSIALLIIIIPIIVVYFKNINNKASIAENVEHSSLDSNIVSENTEFSNRNEISDTQILSNDDVTYNKPIASINVKDFGTIEIELYPDKAPNTVKNFIALANNGFYDGLTFHRVVKDFMIQGGDKNGNGSGYPTLDDLKGNGNKTRYSIKGEMSNNGYTKNTIKMEAGVIAMATANYTNIDSSLKEEGYNSADSQFFILQKDYMQLNGEYAGFGKVIKGMDVVNKIASVEVEAYNYGSEDDMSEVSKPVEYVIISSIDVETFGINYGYPETLKPFNYNEYLWNKE